MNKKIILAFSMVLMILQVAGAQVYRRFNPEDKLEISIESKLNLIQVDNISISPVCINQKQWNQFVTQAKNLKYTGFTPSSTNSESIYMNASAWEIIVWCNLLSELNGYKPVYVDNAGGVIRRVPKDKYDWFMEDWALFGGEAARKTQVVGIDLTADGYRIPSKAELEKILLATKITPSTKQYIVQYNPISPFKAGTETYNTTYAYSVVFESNRYGNNFREYEKCAGLNSYNDTLYTGYCFYVVRNK